MSYQNTFLTLALQHQALRFGEFTLKSGRISPYFFNAGHLYTGIALKLMGECYAKAIQDAGFAFDVLFGPAYKGIPLAAATAIALGTPYAFNRKEAKDHGEGGSLIGAPLAQQRVLIIDDVITAGTAIRESLQFIQAQQGKVAGIVVALDRQEKGQGQTNSAIQEIQKQYHLPVKAIITLADILAFVEADPHFGDFREGLMDYRRQYGIG